MNNKLMLAKPLAMANLSIYQNEAEAHNGSRLALRWPLSPGKIQFFGSWLKNAACKDNNIGKSEITTQLVLRIKNDVTRIQTETFKLNIPCK